MPSGKPIDWAERDDLIIANLPSMTIEEFQRQFLPNISTKAVGTRARKIGIKPAKYFPTIEHKDKIAKTVAKIGDIEIMHIRELRETHSVAQMANIINVDELTIHRAIAKHNIELSDVGRDRAKAASCTASLGKKPWNKGGELTEETKIKISEATRGEKNSQYGKGMTEEEKERWREAYFANGVKKMRVWLGSNAGKIALAKSIAATTTEKFRQRCSDLTSLAILKGKVYNNTRGVPTHLITSKGGEFTTRSSYETRFVEMLEADDSVLVFVYEPLRIQYQFEGISLWYIPDFLVKYINGREELIEIKPRKLTTIPKNVAKIKAGEAYTINFRVVTEDGLGLSTVRF